MSSRLLQVVFFLSNRYVLHQSIDGGATWAQSSAFPGVTGNPLISSITLSSDRRRVRHLVCPLLFYRIVLCVAILFRFFQLMVVGSGVTRNIIWTLEVNDAGVPSAWTANLQSGHFNQIEPHPKHPEWVAALSENAFCLQADQQDKCSQDVRSLLFWTSHTTRRL
jgi:hypothetical protein